MKIFMRLVVLCIFSPRVYSDDRDAVVLRAYVPPSINNRIIQTQLSKTQSLVTFSTQMNSRFLEEQQKFEVEGMNQTGLEATLKKVSKGERVIQYELLVNHLKETMPTHKPIFLKISAN